MKTATKTIALATLLIGALAVGTAYAAGPGQGQGKARGQGYGMQGQGPCATLSQDELAQRQELRAEHRAQRQDLRDAHRAQMIEQGFTPQGPKGPQQ